MPELLAPLDAFVQEHRPPAALTVADRPRHPPACDHRSKTALHGHLSADTRPALVG
jgi:hypothetical protein